MRQASGGQAGMGAGRPRRRTESSNPGYELLYPSACLQNTYDAINKSTDQSINQKQAGKAVTNDSNACAQVPQD